MPAIRVSFQVLLFLCAFAFAVGGLRFQVLRLLFDACGMLFGVSGFPPPAGQPCYITHLSMWHMQHRVLLVNNNNNKRPLTPKSMPPAGDEHAQLKT